MENQNKIPNRLINETSPYLLQHAENPVDWFPWGEEAFEKARREDKPVFLSIGYSTCHWCHVMAHESFEDAEVARILNRDFVAIKVDKEERPDIDSVYMAVCEAFTGGGGWPMSIFMTAERKPFFAGTYFPKTARYGSAGFLDILRAVKKAWETERGTLLSSAEEVGRSLAAKPRAAAGADEGLIEAALAQFKQSFDEKYGGFGGAPKFPAPHNLLFLMACYEKNGDGAALEMAEKTLMQMYRGGLFDHIGGGFSRYSTDRRFLVPHFEKMLYDNALLIMAYCKAHSLTGKAVYLRVAERTADFILREMTSPDGGFYSAEDADSEGVEGKYYVFSPEETMAVLGEAGRAFNSAYGISEGGNFEGKSIPNLLPGREADAGLEGCLKKLYEYRRRRSALRLDDKILTSWNGLMIAAMCELYRAGGDKRYLAAAERARRFIEAEACDGDALFVSFRAGRRGAPGFLDDHAFYIFALLELYGATLEGQYLRRARELAEKTAAEFCDGEGGGFFMYANEHEEMLFRPKETYDGAMPSGNSMMAYDLVRLSLLTGDGRWEREAERQLSFMGGAAARYPMGHAMFLCALSDYLDAPEKITIVPAGGERFDVPSLVRRNAIMTRLGGPTEEYPLLNGKTTYYVCKNHACLPPVNEVAGEVRADNIRL